MRGFLCYDNNKTVGWCNAGPRVNMTITTDYDEQESDKIGAITCFIIAKDYRKMGVARLLLKTACEVFKNQGFKYVEGYPMKDVEGDAPNHWGPMKLYISEGFEEYAKEDNTIVMRKTLIE